MTLGLLQRALFAAIGSLALLICGASGAAEDNSGARRAPSAAQSLDRFIVQWRKSSSQAAQGEQTKTANAAVAADRRLSLSTGVRLKSRGVIAPQTEVLELDEPVDRRSVPELLEKLRADPDVAHVAVDRRRHPHAVPNDPLYTGQWYLQKGEPAAINATDAWDKTGGSANIVVAFLDTGVRFDHPDLQRVAQGGRLLPGYDFVSGDAGGGFRAANDGNGRDSDPSDPGDWVDDSDRQHSVFAECKVSRSSWHGTRVAGIIGARTNNGDGIAGTSWQPLLLPVRVLGKCGGFDSDIIAAMRWAAGLSVSGVPPNPNPAKIINLSLGAEGACSSNYQNVINELNALGVLVIASAGNEGGRSVDEPANCLGALGVAGLRHAGTKVGYSNIGPQIGISAPAGNCVNEFGPCLYSLDTTSNLGDTTPGVSTYTDKFNTNLGTSFSAPIVAGAAALMRSVNTRLTSAQVIVRLQQSATLFPVASNVATCQQPTPTSAEQFECNCTTTTCGTGMLNANAAVVAAQRPFVIVSANPTSAALGQTVNLVGSSSFVADNRTVATYEWTVASAEGSAPALVGANLANASFAAPPAGSVTLRLTVTDSEGAQDFADVTVITPAPPAPPTPPVTNSGTGANEGGGGGGALGLELLALAWALGRRRYAKIFER